MRGLPGLRIEAWAPNPSGLAERLERLRKNSILRVRSAKKPVRG
jgi:hypothetical protein